MTTNGSQYSLNFHGCGSGGQIALGSSAATLEKNGQPLLLIDCGPGTIQSYISRYQALPEAIFITHCHLDHIADLEILTVKAKLSGVAPIKLFAPLSLITTLHQRLATYPETGTMAEGDHDFWQSFQLLPVSDKFCYQQLSFCIYPTRHHSPGSSFALHLPGMFLYSGDTRPIPEILHHKLAGQELIFHDCGLAPNPSHTGLSDLENEYRSELLTHFSLYHYATQEDAEQLESAGFNVVKNNTPYSLPA